MILKTVYTTYQSLCTMLTRSLSDLALFGARLLAAKVFLDSGLVKWSGWFDFDEQQYDLFLYEFFCPDPVREGALLLCDATLLDYPEGSLMVPFVELLALFAGVAEVLFPVLLIAGLLTRVGALGLLGMTLFIQLAVFPSWDHWWNPAAWWAMVLVSVLALGPGRISLDYWLKLDRQKISSDASGESE